MFRGISTVIHTPYGRLVEHVEPALNLENARGPIGLKLPNLLYVELYPTGYKTGPYLTRYWIL